MKSSLALFAEPVLANARRLLWLSLWLLCIPMAVYVAALDYGHSLGILQWALLAVSLIGLVIINAETAVVIYSSRRSNPWFDRGLLQRWCRVRQRRLSSVVPESLPPQEALPVVSVPLVSTPFVSVPFVSVIVAAYLPNEQDIIEDTLLHWLTQVRPPSQGWEIILAYNTPMRLPVEDRLQVLARRYPALVLLPVPHSHSKAENLNAALQVATGEMTGIFDADHHPAADCLSRAWAWLYQGRYEVVQGRNIIRNAQDSWLTQLIAVEFECIYGISHYGRSLLADTALFGGSNGYWR